MSTNLSDLKLETPWVDDGVGHVSKVSRPATIADLVAALIAEGGFIRSVVRREDGDLDAPGSYLVFPIEKET